METPPPQQPDPTNTSGYPRPASGPTGPTGPTGPMVGATIRFDVIGEAFKMVFADLGTWAVAALCIFAVMAVLLVAFYFVLFAAMIKGGFIIMLFGDAFLMFVMIAAINVMMANMYRMAIMALSGIKPNVNEMFKFGPNSTNVIVASLLVGLATGVAAIFCYIPAFIVGGLLMFAMPLVVDRNMAPMDAINASINALKKDVVMAALFFFVIGICAGVGEVLCFIGVILTLPVAPIAIAMLYRDYIGFASSTPDPMPVS